MTAAENAGLSSLRGLRVIEMGVWVAAPSAAALLADWGADVIKIEAPAGDPMRRAFGSLGIGDDVPNPAFAQDNRGKRSVVLDLRDDNARAALEELLATADVFVTNLRPDALDGLGLEPDATVERHPHLVYCSVSGYGLQGQDRNRPAYDIGAFWARSGLSVQLANSEGVPLNARGGIGDHISGLAALAGLLAAVLEQRHNGRGRVVEVSLLRTGSYVLGWDLSLQANLGKVAPAEARHSNQTPLMNSYKTKDGKWLFFMGLEADRHIGNICRGLGREDLLDDPRFADARAIRKNRVEVIATLDEIVATKTLDVWAERFDRAGVWWAPAQGPAAVLEDPQLLANDGIVELGDHTGGPTQRSVNGPVSFSDARIRPSAPAPQLGEHTDAVLAELARSSDRKTKDPGPQP
jgi:crotonobetainyl-CoA:carnitine CoA-transferase CaiB-like acyl-CoA transferase